ncbi:MAG: transcriptional repressor LexA [candidate division Zixibacteria bacterium]|nr:transcriptional repressor LexA [candidate division Zixibacteria bacterium]
MTLKKPLTNRQKTVLEFIEKFMLKYGNSPTIREIGSDLGISSTNGVRSHLVALIKKGYLKKTGLISRGLSLVKKLSIGAARIPLVGSVPAGYPIDAAENVEGDLAVDESFLPKGESFTLTVMGDSMKDAGIYNGDLVIVKKQSEASKGDIVVAIVDGEATIKRYLPGDGLIILQPENNEFKPITVTPESGEFRIAGRVVGLMRRFA